MNIDDRTFRATDVAAALRKATPPWHLGNIGVRQRVWRDGIEAVAQLLPGGQEQDEFRAACRRRPRSAAELLRLAAALRFDFQFKPR
jgi:hypothetical protein